MKDSLEILARYFEPGSKAYQIVVEHSTAVKNLALKIADKNPNLNLNRELLEQAAMLHDIGIIKTNAPDLGCFGSFPYICHGYLGREMLEAEGLPEVAPFCERHTGTGISLQEIINQKLPIPHREMMPVSTEELLICYADKFFSKSGDNLSKPKKLKKVYKNLARFGEDKLRRFDEMIGMFGYYFINEF